ncbi:MAG: MarR family transcriptional regulator [Gammaproteobacteria bacterium]|jgi:DNA-binding MarR family transcriptional regulator|nr:MarR family transcriptional regulator [Gammaproteobacteria bacterium]HEV7445359.1 MarR family transcriptional regulator [Steroidobacteraceae bacterium]
MGTKGITAKSHVEDVIESWRQERPDLDLGDFLTAIIAMRLGRQVDDKYDRFCRERYKISGADMRVLFALRRAGKPYARRPTDLFRALLVTSGAITKQVDRLIQLGLVVRETEESDDNARFRIQLTPTGLRITNQATELLSTRSPIAPGLRALSRSERATLERLLPKVLIAIEEAEDET